MENNKSQKLSIIIPCYNCQTTLEESLRSVYTQNFTNPFEIIMIDDGSTDNTLNLIKKLVKKYPYTKYHIHEKNRGGGAARNTGIKKSTGDLIFILDSDDIIPENMLPKMINYLNEKKCDGVIFAETRFFYGNTKNSKIKISKNNANYNTILKLSDLFIPEKGFLTMHNFLYTKKSFLEGKSYPENHGFDTQHFGFKYLAEGFQVYICPDSYYLHRQANKKSYFERVYENGEFSKNFYLIIEDIIYLFSLETIRLIIQYDIFKNTKNNNHIKKYLENIYQKKTTNFFTENFNNYTNVKGFDLFYKNFKNKTEPEIMFCLGIYYYKNQDYEIALDKFKEILKLGINTKIIYFNILRTLIALSHKYKNTQNETKTIELISSLTLYKPPIIYNKKNIYVKLINKILNKIKILCLKK